MGSDEHHRRVDGWAITSTTPWRGHSQTAWLGWRPDRLEGMAGRTPFAP